MEARSETLLSPIPPPSLGYTILPTFEGGRRDEWHAGGQGGRKPALTDSGVLAGTFLVANAFAYVADYGPNNVSAFTVNPSTGALTAVAGSPFASGSGTHSIATTHWVGMLWSKIPG